MQTEDNIAAPKPRWREKIKRVPRWLRWILSIFLILVLLVGGLIYAARNKAVPVEAYAIGKQDLEKTVFTSGRLEAVQEQQFFTPVDSTLMELKVEIGDRVKAGDILGRLDTLELERRYQNALAVVAEKEAELARMQASSDELTLAAAEAEYQRAKNHYDAVEVLFQAGGCTSAEVDTARADVARAEASYREAKTKAELNADGKQISSLQSQVDLARQEAVQAKERLDMGNFVADRDGVVTRIGAQQGSRVMEGSELLVVSNDDHLQITASINEIDAGSLKVGQEVSIRCMALPGKEYSGKITRIGGAAVVQQGSAGDSVNVPVTITIEGDMEGLKVGYTVDLTVKTLLKKQVLTVPVEAVFDRDGQSMVYIVAQDRLEERKITTKMGNELYDIVESGLEAGEKIVRNPQPEMTAGMKVVEQPGGQGNDSSN